MILSPTLSSPLDMWNVGYDGTGFLYLNSINTTCSQVVIGNCVKYCRRASPTLMQDSLRVGGAVVSIRQLHVPIITESQTNADRVN